MNQQPPSTSERRSFLTRLNTGAASLAALALGGAAMAQVRSAPATPWQPTRHDKDDWMEIPGRHRLLFDTTSAGGFEDALRFATNFFFVNRSEYGLENSELGVILVARHMSTPLAYNDAMWAKYGVQFAQRSPVVDPRTKETPKRNVHTDTLATLAGQGVQFAVCSMATQGLAELVANAVGGDAGAINAEFIANLVPGARMVPAGIVAVNRAQERGYSLAST